jgi:hypothetical protein
MRSLAFVCGIWLLCGMVRSDATAGLPTESPIPRPVPAIALGAPSVAPRRALESRLARSLTEQSSHRRR